MPETPHAPAWTICRHSERDWPADRRWISARPVETWTAARHEALRMTQADADQLAEDWQSWSDTKGAGYRFSAEQIEAQQ